MDLRVNLDVPDLAQGIAFYTQAFGLKVTRRFGDGLCLSQLLGRGYGEIAPPLV